ncbi:MAG: tetratricopeptide repeat protein [Nitrospirae bacterium]|nr:tetratricopeptide repeat protein [Nitrospirota bacterium]
MKPRNYPLALFGPLSIRVFFFSLLFFYLYLFFVPSTVHAQDAPTLQQEIQTHLSRAMELARTKKIEEAVTELEVVVRLDPKNEDAYFGMGEMYTLLKQRDQALKSYQKTVEINPDNLQANLRLGQFYENQKDWAKAGQFYEKVIALQKGGAESRLAAVRLEGVKRQIRIQELLQQVQTHIGKAENDQALKGVEAILALDPKNAMAYHLRGNVEDTQQRFEEAIKDMKLAVELNPESISAKVELGILYQRKGQTDEAIGLFKDVIERGKPIGSGTPEDKNVGIARGWLEVVESAKVRKAVIEEARTSMEEGNIEATQQSLEESIRLRPKQVQPYLLMAVLYSKAGQRDKALDTLRRAVENNPKSIQAHLQLGLLLEQVGQLEEARVELNHVLSLGKETTEGGTATKHLQTIESDLHFREVNVQIKKGEFEAALSEIKEVIALFPEDASAYMSQGIIYDRMNKTEDAIASIKKAIELRPDYANAHMQLGLVMENHARFDEARAEYENVLSLKPDEKMMGQTQARLKGLDNVAKLYEHTRTARELYDKGKFEESLKETDILSVLNPSNHVTYLFRGMDYIGLKKPLEAIDAFKKALELQPKSTQTRFQLARVYMDEGRFEEAKEQYELIVQVGKGTREGDLSAVELRRLRDISYSVSYNQTMDNNISKGTKPVTGYSSSLNAGFSYILIRNKQMRFSAGGTGSQSVYYQSQGLGNSLAGSLSGQYRVWEEWVIGGSLNKSYGFFNKVTTSTTNNASISASMVGRGIPSRLNLQYSFTGARSFRTKISDTNRHSMSVTGSQQLSPRDSMSLSYSFSSSMNLDPMASNFAYRSNGMSINYSRQITKDLSGNLGANGTYYVYSNPDSVTLFQRFRKTVQYGLSGGLSYPLSDQVNCGLSYSYVTSSTNIHVSSKELQDLTDILASPIPIVGGDYNNSTLSIYYSVAF